MKKRNLLLFFAALLLLAGSILGGCSEKDNTNDHRTEEAPSSAEETQSRLPADEKSIEELIREAKENGPVAPEGELTAIWFDELFRAYYPAELKDIYPEKVYIYGDYETTQPVMCFCSQTVTDLRLLAVDDGTVGDVLYAVDALRPMESLVLMLDFPENQTAFAVSFVDEAGSPHCLSLINTGGSVKVQEMN